METKRMGEMGRASQPRATPRLVKLALPPPWALIGLSLRDGRMMFGGSVPTNDRNRKLATARQRDLELVKARPTKIA